MNIYNDININFSNNVIACFLKYFSTKQVKITLNIFLRYLLLMCVLVATLSCDKSDDVAKTKGLQIGEGIDNENQVPSEFGNYHAIFIGINKYKHWPTLKYAVKDADDIKKILIDQYAFQSNNVTYLSDNEATREGILSAIRTKLSAMDEKGNLLIYYAGHGQVDSLTGEGYWIGVNGDLYKAHTWISASTIQNLLVGSGVKAKSVIAIADACFASSFLKRSGPSRGLDYQLTRSEQGYDKEAYEPYRQKLFNKAKKQSRQVIASGGFEEVPDKSDFATALKMALKNNPYPYFEMERLFFKEVYEKVKFIGQQDPAMSRLAAGPEFDGQFILVKKSGGENEVAGIINEAII